MEKVLALALLLLFTTLTKHQPVNGQVFCRSQISLANEACSLRNFPGMRPPVPLPRQQQQLINESSTTTPAAAGSGAVELGFRDDDEDNEGEGGEGGDGGEGRHRRRHRHSAESRADPYDTACCRRLMAIDNSCVCQAVARLPAFVTSVWHVIRLTPVDGCDISFECPGSFLLH